MSDRIDVQDSEEEEEDASIPSRSVCEERCQSFAEITGTDTALAMFYLQDRKWILEVALNDFFQSQAGSGSSASQSSPAGQCSIEAKQSQSTLSTSAASSASLSSTTLESSMAESASKSSFKSQAPLLQPEKEGRVRVLSWNIDGLDRNNLTSRTESVCCTLMQENAEILFLQEVVECSLTIIKRNLTNYKCFCGLDDPDVIPLGAYFTAMLVRKDCSVIEQVSVAPFPNSKMDRTLLEVQSQIKGAPLTLLTSHLESTAEYSSERKRQLQIGFNRMLAQPDERTVIFGGDLNLREKELKGDSSKPPNVYDLWECTGKRPEAKFTWDLTINDNKQMGMNFQPKCRFDRLYIRHPKNSPVCLKPVYFELTGLQRLSTCHRFASDHWAILAHLDMKK